MYAIIYKGQVFTGVTSRDNHQINWLPLGTSGCPILWETREEAQDAINNLKNHFKVVVPGVIRKMTFEISN